MAEYDLISKTALLKHLDMAIECKDCPRNANKELYECVHNSTPQRCTCSEIAQVCIRITEFATFTDVQPVNRWISVKDRLPESEKEVLVWYRYTWGDASTSYGFGISWWYSNAKQWRDGCLLKGVEVLYWQPLPEPPKDGDVE